MIFSKVATLKCFFVPVFITCSFFATAQTKIIGKLKANIYSASIPQQRLKNTLELCDQGYSLHPDTLMLYADYAYQIARQQNDLRSEVAALYYKSAAFTGKGLLDSALLFADSCMHILEQQVSDPLLMCNVLNQRGRCFVRKNQYRDAIDMAYKMMSIAEKNNEVLVLVKAKTLIGWSFLEMGQLNDALSWHLKALHTTNDTIMLEKYAILFANLATNYNGLNKQDSAFYYINKGINYARKHENLFALSNSLAIASELYVKAGHPKMSEPLLQEVVAIRKLIGDPFYTASDMAQLGYYYANYGQPEKGIAICNEGIELAAKYHLYTKLFFLYGSLAENYKAMGNTEQYSRVMENIIRLKDSVYEKNSAAAIAEINGKFELQKKENTIIQQRLDLVRKTYWIYGISLFLLFTFILLYLFYHNNKRKQAQRMALALAEEKQLAVVSVKEAEENERQRIAADLHDNLGAYAASIVANIDTLMADRELNNSNATAVRELHNNSQSIVSQLGDTIWALKKNTLSLTAVSDRIKLVLQKVQPSYPNIRMDVVENIQNDFVLSPSHGFHLFQVIQEAVINALRHSNCKRLLVNFTADESWKIEIEDDGRGTNITRDGKANGNGLPNMLARAKEADFTVNWVAAQGGGTVVRIISNTN